MRSKAKQTRKSWRKRLLIDGCIILAFLLLMAALVLVAWAVPLGDFAPVEPLPRMSGVLTPIAPIDQTEGHTCGLHAVSSIYRSYGLDPDERRLRLRLGVDNRSFLYDSGTTGSLHPDIYRVMSQDGFDSTSLNLSDAHALEMLDAHVKQGRYALALVRRRENGNMHWVVITRLEASSLQICDSLQPEMYSEKAEDYWSKYILSVILVTPSQRTTQESVWRLHLRGVKDMRRAVARMKEDGG